MAHGTVFIGDGAYFAAARPSRLTDNVTEACGAVE
jgi:hypothetical protein